ncbi:hypothetical protein GALL_529670 [mine drainage metagenome]|uniref:Uncharacterized protein n=1 Tax=mine drainage metagenome TaxID=410659 RepID=A0A1J5P326_9ZZZZ
MFGTGLAKAREILCNREIACHADFLTAADAHAVDTRDDGFVASQDRRNHVVEQTHILPVFLGIAGVIFGIFLGVAACAERLVANAGKHHRNDVAGIRCGAKGAVDALHHIGRVRIELAGIIQPYPGIEQVRNDIAIRSAGGALFVNDAGRGFQGNDVVVNKMGHLIKSCHD